MNDELLRTQKDPHTMIKCAGIRFILINFALFCSNQVGLGQSNSYDIRHYNLLIKPDFKSKAIFLSAVVEIKNPLLETDFAFGMNERYESVDITCKSSPIVVERANRWITVKLSKPSTEVTLTFDLQGNLGRSDDEDREIVADSSLFLLWSDRFYPIDLDRWSTVRTEIVVPSGFRAIAPGKLTETEDSDITTRYVFESTVPMVKFSVFADSRWIKTERQINGIQMQTLLYPVSQKFSDQIFKTSSEILGFYSSIFCPYPYEQFSFVTISDMYARRAFAGFIGYAPRYLEKEFTTTGHDAHETSLLWWGYTTNGAGPGSFQWTEGFGDYAELLYDEQYTKPIPKNFDRFRGEYLLMPAEQDVLYTYLGGNTPQKIVHGKYPWLMHMIRYVVGDSAFRNAMKLVFERFRFRKFTIEDFISSLEKGTGQSLRWWQEEWLERKGVPEIALTSRIEGLDSVYKVTCTIEQRGNIYHFPLEVGIESPKGLQVERALLGKQQQTFIFESKERPTRILLDPKGWVLMKAISME